MLDLYHRDQASDWRHGILRWLVSDFERDVIARSAEVPVLVDFWAPWCGPCRMLGPVLEKVAAELDGAFVLAKINTDQYPEPAARYQVRGIPDVKLFVRGQVVDQFVGALPEAEVRAFVRKHCQTGVDKQIAEGNRRLEQSDTAGAEAAFTQALAGDASSSAAHLGLARLALARTDPEAVAQHVARIPPLAPERDAAAYVEQAAALLAEARTIGSEAEVRARLGQSPEDLEAHYALGAYLAAAQKHREALGEFLAIAERERKWRDEAARKAMLMVFGLLGIRHPLSDEYRRKLVFIY